MGESKETPGENPNSVGETMPFSGGTGGFWGETYLETGERVIT